MAILSKTKKAVKKEVAPKAVATSAVATTNTANTVPKQELFTMTPRITEKANFHAESLNSYTFVVKGNSNKKSIAHAIKTTFKVTPLKIRIVNTADKRVSNRGRISLRSGFKKAYITLKKGDKIEVA